MLTKVKETVLTREGLSAISYGGYLNGESFQQEGIITFNNLQYAAFYNIHGHVCISRRTLPEGAWDELEFTDYEAVKPYDGHNTISIGICPEDGTIHLAFDHHGSPLHYRVSEKGLATNIISEAWRISSFGRVTDKISNMSIKEITYPRFIITPQNKMLFEYRYGTSGDGNQILWEYNGQNQVWTLVGKYINGIEDSCNAYPHGLTFDNSDRLHLTWCWRETPDPSTNHDLMYAYSDDNGATWNNNSGKQVAIAGCSLENYYINKNSPGIKVYSIEQNRGLINQEAQAIDSKGQVHVLLSHLPDEIEKDIEFERARRKCIYFHYWRDINGKWHRNNMGIRPILNFRGKLTFSKNDDLYAILPNLRIAYASSAKQWNKWTVINLDEKRFFSDPIIDSYRMKERNELSIVCQHISSGVISVIDYIDQNELIYSESNTNILVPHAQIPMFSSKIE